MVNLIEQEKDCPDELKEAASSLLYAAPRCGEFPELQEIRAILTARYGKEFANGAIDLRNNCGVSTR
ncbi:IST1-like protein, partial [Tanacetum coccineum]